MLFSIRMAAARLCFSVLAATLFSTAVPAHAQVQTRKAPLGVNHASLEFAPTVGFQSARQLLVVTNLGSSTIAITAVAVTAHEDKFDLSHDCNMPLAPGESCHASIAFRPSSTATVVAQLTFHTDKGPTSIDLEGTGLAPAALVSFTGPSDFGTVERGSVPARLRLLLWNRSSVPAPTGSITVSPPFSVSTAEPCFPLKANARCQVDLGADTRDAGSWRHPVVLTFDGETITPEIKASMVVIDRTPARQQDPR